MRLGLSLSMVTTRFLWAGSSGLVTCGCLTRWPRPQQHAPSDLIHLPQLRSKTAGCTTALWTWMLIIPVDSLYYSKLLQIGTSNLWLDFSSHASLFTGQILYSSKKFSRLPCDALIFTAVTSKKEKKSKPFSHKMVLMWSLLNLDTWHYQL